MSILQRIVLENINRSGHNIQFIGNNSRLATCTGVKIIDEYHLVTTHFVGQKMYLYEYSISDNTSRLLDSIDTTWHGKLITTDLLEYLDGKIMTSNSDFNSVSLYSLDRESWKLNYVKDFDEIGMGFCHGVKFFPKNRDIFVATSYRPNECVYFKSISTEEILLQIDCKPYIPKDVCFPTISEDGMNRIIVIYCDRFPSKKSGIFYNVHIRYYQFDLENRTTLLLDEITIENCHTDSCAYANNKLWLTDGLDHSVIVYDISDRSLTYCNKLHGYDFPHGIDVVGDVLAVSNYGNNSISLETICSLNFL